MSSVREAARLRKPGAEATGKVNPFSVFRDSRVFLRSRSLEKALDE